MDNLFISSRDMPSPPNNCILDLELQQRQPFEGIIFLLYFTEIRNVVMDKTKLENKDGVEQSSIADISMSFNDE